MGKWVKKSFVFLILGTGEQLEAVEESHAYRWGGQRKMGTI